MNLINGASLSRRVPKLISLVLFTVLTTCTHGLFPSLQSQVTKDGRIEINGTVCDDFFSWNYLDQIGNNNVTIEPSI